MNDLQMKFRNERTKERKLKFGKKRKKGNKKGGKKKKMKRKRKKKIGVV